MTSLQPPPLSSPSSVLHSPQPIQQQLSQQQKNPVSLRIYKVLGTNFNDEATRQALNTLSDIYTPTNEEEVGKSVKRDMQRILDRGSRQFLSALGEIDQKLEELQNAVNVMKEDCDAAEKQLHLTTEASKTLLEHASNLRTQRQQIEIKKSIVSLFLARFTLSEDQVETLTSRDVPVNHKFFQTMAKAEQIRADSQVLMVGEQGPSQVGIDITATTSRYLEMGYEKTLRWCSHEFRTTIARDGNLEVGNTMREAIKWLMKRPELLSEAMTLLSQTRQSALLSAFIEALTRGPPRPIELHAHDPMRYIGDMLAWVHQCIAAEREFLEALFSLDLIPRRTNRRIGTAHTTEDQQASTGSSSNANTNKDEEGQGSNSSPVVPGHQEEEIWVNQLLDAAIQKVCVPLKARVIQTIRSQESVIVAFNVAGLVRFYWITMKRTLGEGAVLTGTLKEVMQVAFRVFYGAIEALGRGLLRLTLDVEDNTLVPPTPVLDHIQVLREILVLYQTFSPSSSSSGQAEGDGVGTDEGEGEDNFDKILDVCVDPVLEFCVTAAERKKVIKPRWDAKVFVLNCLEFVSGVLEPFGFTKEKREMIGGIIDGRVSELVEEHYENILADAGLLHLVTVALIQKPDEPLAHHPGTQAPDLRLALSRFSTWLSTDEVVSSPRLSKLTSPALQSRIHQMALRKVARAYADVVREVKKSENRYEAVSVVLGNERPFGRVDLLESIFGIEGDLEG